MSAVQPLRVAVAGHTNTGKTSLIRTLLRDDRFGRIDDAAGTTRYVEKSAILAAGTEILSLFDTPGFEDSSALLQVLQELEQSSRAQTPSDRLREFIARAADFPDFDQETKVLRQALNSDVLLYVIDVREPLLGKYRDEVEILGMAGKPIVPVFNFIADHSGALARWREQMAHFNLHAALEFDTVAFDFEAEKRFYQKLQSLLETHYDALQSLIDYRLEVWNNLVHAAAQRVYQLLAEVTCYRQEIAGGSVAPADIDAMQDVVRQAERRALQDLLRIFAFTQLDVDLQQLPVQDGRWALDIFSPSLLKEFGLGAGATALKGAAAGAGVDLMVGGLSLGTGTMLGAALGAGWAAAQRYGQELKAAWRGNDWLCVDEDTIGLLYLRQRQLLHTLTRRGHAAQDKLRVANEPEHAFPSRWGQVINILRQHPGWQQGSIGEPEYLDLQTEVVGWLLQGEGR